MISKNIFDLFGITPDIKNKLSDISIKDYLKNNEHIAGAFNELSAEDKSKVVESMNKIQSAFADVFGTKAETWTADDFAGATVDVTEKTYSSNKDSVAKENSSSDDVFTEAIDNSNDINDLDEHKFDANSDECRNCECFGDCLCDAMNYCDNNCDECDYQEYCEDAEELSDCENEGDCCDCPYASSCTIGEDCDDVDEDNAFVGKTICEELLEELEDEDTDDEEIVDSIAEYVMGILGEKKNKKYVLHPGVNDIPPAVKVVIPTEVCEVDIMDSIHIMTLLRDVLKDLTGAHDVYINKNNENVVVYIPLKKNNK